MQVVQLTRLQRSSSSTLASASATSYWKLPVMTDNLVYDMDSTTSPSSSDSDSPPKKRPVVPIGKFADTLPVAKYSDTVPVAKNPDTLPDAEFKDTLPEAKFQDTPLRNVAPSSTSHQKSAPTKVSSLLVQPTGRLAKSQTATPLRERSTMQKSKTLSSLRQKQSPTRGEFKKTRRRIQTTSKDAAPAKRWM